MSVKETILRWLHQNPYRTAREVAEGTGLTDRSVHSYFYHLKRQGLVVGFKMKAIGSVKEGGRPPSEYRLSDEEFHRRVQEASENHLLTMAGVEEGRGWE